MPRSPLAAALDHPFTSAYARFHAGLLRLWRREPDTAHTLATGLLDLAEEHEFRIWTAAGTVLRGAARAASASRRGLADVRNGIGVYGRAPVAADLLAVPPVRSGPRLRRRRTTGRGPAASIGDGDHRDGSGASLLPELAIAKGDLLRGLSPVDGGDVAAEAEPWYRQALDLATELGALTAQLRASTRLARLRVEAGDPVGASAISGRSLARLPRGSRPRTSARRESCSRRSRRPSDLPRGYCW